MRERSSWGDREEIGDKVNKFRGKTVTKCEMMG
jgi:hypothetical protein